MRSFSHKLKKVAVYHWKKDCNIIVNPFKMEAVIIYDNGLHLERVKPEKLGFYTTRGVKDMRKVSFT